MSDGCQCRDCQISPVVKRIKAALAGEDLAIFTEILGRMMDAEFSVAYEDAIKDGSWPNAVEILERRLAAVKGQTK